MGNAMIYANMVPRICATGFDSSFKPRWKIIGPKGNNLQDDWAEKPESYLGIAA